MTVESLIILMSALAAGGLCVWLAAHARRRPRNTGESPSSISSRDLVRVPASRPPITLEETSPSTAADALVLGDVDNPLLEITASDVSGDSSGIDVDPTMLSTLQPLLQRAPEFLRVGQEMTTKTYRLVFSPTVTRALNKGTLELVPTAGELLPVARQVGGTKKFVKLGRVAAEGGVRLANVAAMSWQIAAIATAQQYLGEINARLAGIERGIDDIRTWLEEEKKGELRAAVHLLREYYRAIARGDLHAHEEAAIYHQLDAIERTCLGIGELAREMSRRRLDELKNLDVREWTDRRGSAERAVKWVKHNREALDLIFLAQSVRILACQVKAMLPGDRERLRDRIEHARKESGEAQRLFEATGEVLDGKVRELRQRTGKVLALGGKLDEDYRQRINMDFANAREHTAQALQRLRDESMKAIDFAERFEQLDTVGLTLDVRVGQGGTLRVLSAKAAST